MTDEILYTVGDVAKYWRVSQSTVYNLVERGLLEHYRIGTGRGAIRFTQAQISAFLASRLVTEPPDEDGPLVHIR